MVQLPSDLPEKLAAAVAHFWRTRRRQKSKQEQSGRTDQGGRGAVTGGAQMDGFIQLLTDLIVEAGIDRSSIYYRKRVDLPGFFRPTKEWDLIVVHNGQLLVAVEAKSQVGSFGNNFNNRTEEAMGSAMGIMDGLPRRGVCHVAPALARLHLSAAGLRQVPISREGPRAALQGL